MHFLPVLPIAGEPNKDFNFDINGLKVDIGPITDMDQLLCKKINYLMVPIINEHQDPHDSPIYEEFQPRDLNIIDRKHKHKPTPKAWATAGDDDEWITINEEAKLEEAMSITIRSNPCTVLEAQQASDWPQWKERMDYKINSLKSHHTWDIIDHPNNKGDKVNIVSSKWVSDINVMKLEQLSNIVHALLHKDSLKSPE